MTHMTRPAGNGLQRLLTQLPAPDHGLEFPALLEALYSVRFTGPLTVDFLNGIPRQINLGQPIKLTIVQGGVDKARTTDTG